MYSAEDLNSNKIIWFFRDPRSGSTWFLYRLALALKRSNYFIDKENNDIFGLLEDTSYYTKKQNELKIKAISDFFKNRTVQGDDYLRVLNTHEFAALETLDKYDRPLLFRSVRRNKTHQLASLVTANQTKVFNTQTLSHRDRIIGPRNPITVSKDKIYAFIARVREADEYWNRYANQYENEVVYYEDLLAGYQSKLIDMYFKMNPDEDTSEVMALRYKYTVGTMALTLKLPYKYEEIITNYEQMDLILRSEFDYAL